MSRIALGFIALLLFLVAVPVLLAWSGARRRLRVGRASGAVVLRMPRGHNVILAMIAIVPCGAFAVLALAVAWRPGANGWVLGLLMGLLGSGLGGYFLALEARGRIRLDDFTIERVGALTRRRCAWDRVSKITFNPVHNWFFLTLASGATLYVTEGMDGLADFADLALRRLPPRVLAASPDAVEALRELSAS